MARDTTVQKKVELIKSIRELDAEDQERVLELAKRLAGNSPGASRESLAKNDPNPSYRAAVGEDAYEMGKAHQELEEEQREKHSWG